MGTSADVVIVEAATTVSLPAVIWRGRDSSAGGGGSPEVGGMTSTNR